MEKWGQSAPANSWTMGTPPILFGTAFDVSLFWGRRWGRGASSVDVTHIYYLSETSDNLPLLVHNADGYGGDAPKSDYQVPPVSRKGIQPVEVDLSKLRNPPSKPVADPAKLAGLGTFDPKKADTIIVEIVGESKKRKIVESVTREENAKRAAFTTIWAHIFKRQ